MYSAMLGDARFQRMLGELDEESAREVRERGCTRGACGGVLHSARYRRKPRGMPEELSGCECWRHSFCCAKDGCRGRTTPPSLRFLGPKVYLAAVVAVITAMRCGVTPARMQRLKELVGVSRQTAGRWRQWWQERLPQTGFWRAVSGSFPSPVEVSELPLSLLEQFTGEVEARLLALLRWVVPLSGGRGSAKAM